MATDWERRYVRKPNERSKPQTPITSYYYAYLDEEFKGEVKLTNDTKKRYEAMGYTFKRRRG
jgi:hypothetical protein